MIRPPISLPISIARCPSTRTEPCSVSSECARALVDGTGRPVKDYSAEPRGYGGACMHHLPADRFRQAAKAPEPTVHEAVRGIA